MAVEVQKGLPIVAMDSLYYISATRVGQHAMTFLDRILCILEALNFYGAPVSQQQEARQESKEVHDYKRPLPWILFIPMLLYCRVVRVFMSAVAFLCGWQPVTAMSVVEYLQSLRRKVRYVKIQGSRMMQNPEGNPSNLPWTMKFIISMFTWGPLQFFTIVARLVLGEKQYHVYAAAPQPRSRRSLKKLKSVDNSECNTAELLDKYADEDDNDPMNDPDFEVKSTDLVTETEDEDDEENSEPEEDTEVRENGAANDEKKGTENPEEHNQNEHPENQPEQQNHNEQHHEEHHHY